MFRLGPYAGYREKFGAVWMVMLRNDILGLVRFAFSVMTLSTVMYTID